MNGRLVWENPDWLWPAGLLAACAALVAIWAYAFAQSSGWVRAVGLGCKLLTLLAIVLFIGDPRWETRKPVPGANEFWMVGDNSASLGLRSASGGKSRGEQWLAAMSADPLWLSELERDYQVRRFTFDDKLRPQRDFGEMEFLGQSSQLYTALQQLASRVRHRPCAGILLFSDGNATDSLLDPASLRDLPPVYCVVPPVPRDLVDLAVGQIQVTQSNFESAPVTIQADLATLGDWSRPVVVQLIDQQGSVIEQQRLSSSSTGQGKPVRMRFRPEGVGIQGYRLRAFAEGDEADFDQGRTNLEVTLENNQRWCVVDRGGGPYRVLYVGGRPNWEYKFLRRALLGDEEVHVVGLLRVARREPRFAFRSRAGESSNPIYKGFGADEEDVERYDQPVMVRLGGRDAEELKDGFPKTREELFGYHALVIDDVEAEFFTTDQHQLVRDFVTRRGGALLMLGGPDTFREGRYQDTPIGTIIPVYLDGEMLARRATDGSQSLSPTDAKLADLPFRLRLTREGWLEPWLRLHESIEDETRHLAQVPPMYNPSVVGDVRPGASKLVELHSSDGDDVPMLVTQRYGAGRTVALTVADLWRWQMQGEQVEGGDEGETHLGQFWRQMTRWLVSEVTPRLTAEARVVDARLRIEIKAVDREFEPSGEAEIELALEGPDGKQFTVSLQPSSTTLGTYEVELNPSVDGFYRATATARFPGEESPVLTQLGWTWNPRREELEHLVVNQSALERLAHETGGAVLTLDDLPARMRNLPTSEVEVSEPVRTPIWHRWWWLSVALVALAAEWGLRRLHGLA